jgi:CSLREA domain-containing protein
MLSVRVCVRSLALLLAAAIPLFGATLPAWAGTTINVNTTADVVGNDGVCSLREAITAANTDAPSGALPGECPAGSGSDVVNVPPGTYNLNGSELAPASAMTVAGTGPTASILDGTGAHRVLSVPTGTVSLSGLTIRNGSAAQGAGIANSGVLTVTSSTITGNTATDQGGGIFNGGTLTVSNSTIAGNTATNQGGGLFNGGTATFSFATVSGNGAGSGGGVFSSGTGSTTTLTGTVLAKSTSGGDCAGGSLTSSGHNLVQAPGSCFSAGATDVTGKDPKLGPLGDNGGPTATLRPATGSPVLDAAGSTCPATDQRGLARFQGQACDIGSVEPECTMIGTPGKDYLEGGAGVDLICGFGGNDRLKGNAGNDFIVGGDGDDALHAADGNDVLIAGDGNDHLRPGTGTNVLDGGPGNDTIEYGNLTAGVTVDLGAGTTNGGASDSLTGIECVDGTDFNDTLIGTPGPNAFTGKGGNDTLTGLVGNDTLNGEAGNDTLNGGDDADNLFPGSGTNTVHGDAGTDVASYATVTGGGVSVDLGLGTATGAVTDTLSGIENVTGTNLNDVLVGNGSNNSLSGLAGADTLRGLAGTDPLNGGDGGDTLEGGENNDPLRPGPGANSVNGGPGVDTVDYSALTGGGVSVNLGGGRTTGAATDSLVDVENATGTKQADSLFGSAFANVLSGLAGADTLNSAGDLAKDTVNGGVDADTDVCTADPVDKVVNCF